MTAPGILQVCSNCSSRWPVALGAHGPVPARWCPRCRGNLLAPVSAMAPPQHAAPHQAPTAQPRTAQTAARPAAPAANPPRSRSGLPSGYRWVARMLAPPVGESPARQDALPLGPTPRYRQMPRWGLPVGPAPAAPGPASAPRRYLAWASGARAAMRMLVWMLTLAVLAEAFRYGLLLWNQSHLVGRITLAISDSLSLVFGVLTPVAGVLAAIACAAWLVRARAERHAQEGLRDPRSPRSIFLAVLIPGWNLLMPGVLLTELATLRAPEAAAARGPGLPPTGSVAGLPAGGAGLGWPHGFGDRFQRTFATLSELWLVRFWWGMWVLTNITVVGVLLTRFDTSMQGRADGVLFTLYANVLALAVAGLTIKVMARFDGRPATQDSEPARWVIAT